MVVVVLAEEEKEVVVVILLACSIGGPFEAWGCFAIIFGEICGRKITGDRPTNSPHIQICHMWTHLKSDWRFRVVSEFERDKFDKLKDKCGSDISLFNTNPS